MCFTSCLSKLFCGSGKESEETEHNSYAVESKRPSIASDKFQRVTEDKCENSNFLSVASEPKAPRKDRKSVILDEVLMAAMKANPTISSMRNAWGGVPEDDIDVEIVRKWLDIDLI
ncbi:uncharacterized protein LOC129568183 [Sitodiplosis mosellana]|uniref:uncharacterized protein LOC129568183 n=1 Tax=Sitodiplosis mosellana TaxID=263140 RepID=UPI0024449E42|nr:uncharacterized protein LOC129568183 [Sitodiplosis mosellana]